MHCIFSRLYKKAYYRVKKWLAVKLLMLVCCMEQVKTRIDAKRHYLTVCIATAAAGLLCAEQLLGKTHLTTPKYWLTQIYAWQK